MNYNSDKNIEEKIKDIILTKLKDPNFQNSINNNNNKLVIVEKIFEMFPDLSDPKQFIKEDKVKDNNTKNKLEIVLDEIEYNNIIYYKDIAGGIWDANTELVGVTKKDNNEVSYIFFADLDNDDKNNDI